MAQTQVHPSIAHRVATAKATAEALALRTHTYGYAKSPARRLTAEERKLNLHNAQAERTFAADLLRGGRRGLTPHSPRMSLWLRDAHEARQARARKRR